MSTDEGQNQRVASANVSSENLNKNEVCGNWGSAHYTLSDGILTFDKGGDLSSNGDGTSYSGIHNYQNTSGLFDKSNKITKVVFSTKVSVEGASNLFASFGNVKEYVNLHNLDLSKATRMDSMFVNNYSLTDIDLTGMNTSSITYIDALFNGCNNLQNVKLSGLDLSKVTNIWNAFLGCNDLNSLDLSNTNLQSLTSISNMFGTKLNLEKVNFSNLNLSNVSDMTNLFAGMSNLKDVDFSNLNINNAVSLINIFMNDVNLENVNLNGSIANNLTNVKGMFANNSSLRSIIIPDTWDTSKVSDIILGKNTILNASVALPNVPSTYSGWVQVDTSDNLIHGQEALSSQQLTDGHNHSGTWIWGDSYSEASQNKTITRTINYIDGQGQSLRPSVIQTVTFTRTKYTDAVTGEVTYGNWSSDQSFEAVESPVLKGYTADKTVIAAQTINGDSQDLSFTVKYTKDATGSDNQECTNTPSNSDNQDGSKTTSNPGSNGTDQVSSENAKLQTDGKSLPSKQQNTIRLEKYNKLPDTANKDKLNSLTGLLGVLGFFWLSSRFKKKD